MRQTLLPVCGCRNRGFAIEPAPVLLRKNVSRAFDSASTCDSHGDRLSWRHGSPKGSTNGKFPLTYLTLGKILLRMGRKKNPHAQALGALGGKARAENLSDDQLAEIGSKGGKARAERLSAARRREIAELAVAARERNRAQQQKKGKH